MCVDKTKQVMSVLASAGMMALDRKHAREGGHATDLTAEPTPGELYLAHVLQFW